MGRPSKGTRTKRLLRLPGAVDDVVERRAEAAGLDWNSYAVLVLCQTCDVKVPKEYATELDRFVKAGALGGSLTTSAA